MANRHSLGTWVKRLPLSLTSALILASAMFVFVVLVSARTARSASIAETVTSVGPVCFYRDGYPICVERSGPNALTTPDAVADRVLEIYEAETAGDS